MKNQNGSGSVFKQKGKRRKPWIAVVTLGYTEEGKQIKKSIGTTATKKEAQELLFSYLNNPKLYSKKSFKEIKELWWENYKKKIDNPRTINTNIYRLRALEPLDDMCIADIKLFDLQQLFDKMTTSWSFKNACKSILNMIFEYAFKNEFVSSNKVKFIELGKKEKVIDRKIFTQKEIEILWENLNSNTYHGKYTYIILILIYTGMRIGELINLKNEDIDLENRILKIRVSKTNAGMRTIPINPKIYPLIKNNLVINREYFVKGDSTTQLSYSTFKPRFIKLMKELGLEHTIHDTRHTFATLLSNANANPTTIVKLIGHSNYSTTENIYTHKDIEELEKAINLI